MEREPRMTDEEKHKARMRERVSTFDTIVELARQAPELATMLRSAGFDLDDRGIALTDFACRIDGCLNAPTHTMTIGEQTSVYCERHMTDECISLVLGGAEFSIAPLELPDTEGTMIECLLTALSDAQAAVWGCDGMATQEAISRAYDLAERLQQAMINSGEDI